MMRTALFEKQQALNAQMTKFAGWELPLYYKGITHEHDAVRQNVGVFDVSHMGRILVSGKDALPFLDFLSTNTIVGKSLGSVVYTFFCNDTGGVIDDLLVYIVDTEQAFVVVNAINREVSLAHMQQVARNFQVQIEDTYADESILSLQGPSSVALVQKLFPEATTLHPMHHIEKATLTISTTGYTGERGFEFFGSHAAITLLWDQLLNESVEPCGLGARDLLRIEMGYPLYGHEFDMNSSALENLAAWTVKLEKHDFFGKKALAERKSCWHPVALLGSGRVPAREGYSIFKEGKKIGRVTSGAFSPSLQKPLALALIEEVVPHGTILEIEIRNVPHSYQAVSLPFYKKLSNN